MAVCAVLTAPARAAVPGWTSGPEMPWAVGDQKLVPLQSGKVLMVGGWDSEYSEARTALFDPVTNKWTQTGSLKTDRYSHTATRLPDGRVLVTGGTKGSWYTPPGPQVLASAELYDEATGQWTAAKPMSAPRTGATATLLANGRVLVAGGTADGSTEIYDPASDTWTPADGLSYPRSGHSATLLPDGTVMVAGGTNAGAPIDYVETYLPAENLWDYEGRLGQARTGHFATPVGPSSALFIGGWGPSPLATAQIVRRRVGPPSPAGVMSTPRAMFGAAVLDDGRVLVAGGMGDIRLSSAELYDPVRNLWSGADSMTVPRVGHAAVRLPDGRVLFAGGWSSTGTFWPIKTTEVYTPATTVELPATADAGRLAIGTSGALHVDVKNTGGLKLMADSVSLSTGQADEFTVLANGCAGTVVAGAGCRITVGFTPRGVGVRATELVVTANTEPSRQVVKLAGTGFVPVEPTPTATPVEPTPTATPVVVPTVTATPVPTPTPPPSRRVAVPFRSRFTPPPGLSRAQACRGTVRLQLRAGSRVLATKTARLDKRCQYSTTFKILRAAAGGRRVLAVVARFRGNRYLAPTRATYQVRVPA
jgi:N-acetylneuraminic acid mutarotase